MACQAGVDGLAAEGQHRQRHPGQQAGRLQLGEHRRRGVDQVDAVAPDHLDERLGVALNVVADDVHAVPVEQGGQRLPRRVERERPRVRDAQRPAAALGGRTQHVADVIGGVGQQRLMSSDDALGLSGGARGEDDVGALARGARRGPVVGGVGLDGAARRRPRSWRRSGGRSRRRARRAWRGRAARSGRRPSARASIATT